MSSKSERETRNHGETIPEGMIDSGTGSPYSGGKLISSVPVETGKLEIMVHFLKGWGGFVWGAIGALVIFGMTVASIYFGLDKDITSANNALSRLEEESKSDRVILNKIDKTIITISSDLTHVSDKVTENSRHIEKNSETIKAIEIKQAVSNSADKETVNSKE